MTSIFVTWLAAHGRILRFLTWLVCRNGSSTVPYAFESNPLTVNCYFVGSYKTYRQIIFVICTGRYVIFRYIAWLTHWETQCDCIKHKYWKCVTYMRLRAKRNPTARSSFHHTKVLIVSVSSYKSSTWYCFCHQLQICYLVYTQPV